MAINIRCKACKADLKLTAKKCKCGALIPKKKKTYRVIVSDRGRRISRTVTNLELAREIESKLKIDLARGAHGLRKKTAPTLVEVWKRYLPWAEESKKPKSAATDFFYYRKHLGPFFADKKLDRISPFDIEKLVMAMKKSKSQRGKPYAPATIKHVLQLLSRLYVLAGKWGMYDGLNPCSRVEKPKINNEVTEHLTSEEIARLLETLESWPILMSVSIIRFLLYTGIRRGELFRLEWRDVDFDRQTITLRDPKGKKDVILPISQKAVKVLRDVPLEHETDYIFYAKNGRKRRDFRGPWFRVRKAAELPENFRLHGLRHHFASSLVSAGVDLYTVSKLLSHKDTVTTQRYAHLADQALRDAVKLSDKLQEPKQSAGIINLKELRNG